jgi:phosphoenolpyruvate-protein phosphotransferase (PTS system enzyme I)
MKVIQGISASSGMAKGKVLIYQSPCLDFVSKKETNIEEELQKLIDAFQKSSAELDLIVSNLSSSLGKEYAHIFRAQMTMLEDEDFFSEINEKIKETSQCSEEALHSVYSDYAALFTQLGDDDYNKQRLVDLTDLYKRVMRNLLGLKETNLADIPKDSIIVATELLPSDTAAMHRDHVNGLISEKGGVTSHVAILAKSLSIPAIIGIKDAVEHLNDSDLIYMDVSDFEKAVVYVAPDENKIKELDRKITEYEDQLALTFKMKDQEPITEDGRKVTLSANIGSDDDFEQALLFGAKSVGLLRTEFLFINSAILPDEEIQFEFYKKVAAKLNPGMVIIRTLDIGGDKEVKGLDLPKEDNPFLGVRGIRFCFEHVDLFKTQLKAILRAAKFGNIKIMFPMIADAEELVKAKALLAEAADELNKEGKSYNTDIDVGVMIETPAAVMTSDILTEEGDFVSVGTNDLTQYLLSADRINENVSQYYRAFSPAVFRALDMTVKNTKKNGKWVGICGELGGINFVIPVLIGLGIEELSMNPQMLPQAIKIIRNLKFSDCQKAAQKVLSMKSDREIKTFLRSQYE